MPFDEDPEDGGSLFEVVAVSAIASIVAPGVIWWLKTLAEIVWGPLP